MAVNIKKENSENKIILFEGVRFRVCSITKLLDVSVSKDDPQNVEFVIANVPLNQGLWIEEFINTNLDTQVICSLLYDKDSESIIVEDCNRRSVEMLDGISQEDLDDYLVCYYFALNHLQEANNLDLLDSEREVC